MTRLTIDDLIAELDNASQLASECQKPSAMIAATLAKAKLLGLDKPIKDVEQVANRPTVIRLIAGHADDEKELHDHVVFDVIGVSPDD